MKILNEAGQIEYVAQIVDNVENAAEFFWFLQDLKSPCALEDLASMPNPFFDQAEEIANNTPVGDNMVIEFSARETFDGNTYRLTMPTEWFDNLDI